MSTFKKRETVVQNIAYMGLMAAINVVFVLLTTFVPVLFFLIVFVLPLTSTVVALHCKKRYYPIYAVATIGICMLCTMWKIDDTIFYIIPSIITGFIFALMVEKEISAPWIIITTTIIQLIFSCLAIPLIIVLFGRDIVITFASIFGLQSYQYIDYIAPASIFFLSLIQCSLSFIVTNEEIKKFGYELKEAKLNSYYLLIALWSSMVVTMVFALTYKPLSYTSMLISLYFVCVLIAGLLQRKKKWIYIVLPISFFLSFFLFAIFYPYAEEPLGLLLLNIFFFVVSIIVLIDNSLLNKQNKDTI